MKKSEILEVLKHLEVKGNSKETVAILKERMDDAIEDLNLWIEAKLNVPADIKETMGNMKAKAEGKGMICVGRHPTSGKKVYKPVV